MILEYSSKKSQSDDIHLVWGEENQDHTNSVMLHDLYLNLLILSKIQTVNIVQINKYFFVLLLLFIRTYKYFHYLPQIDFYYRV